MQLAILHKMSLVLDFCESGNGTQLEHRLNQHDDIWHRIFTSTSLTWAVVVLARTAAPNLAFIMWKVVSTLDRLDRSPGNHVGEAGRSDRLFPTSYPGFARRVGTAES